MYLNHMILSFFSTVSGCIAFSLKLQVLFLIRNLSLSSGHLLRELSKYISNLVDKKVILIVSYFRRLVGHPAIEEELGW